MNGYQCTANDVSIVVWESMDADKIDRALQPVMINFNEDATVQNKLNAYMDHNCDSFYTTQQRLSRFPGIVYSPNSAELVAEATEVTVSDDTPSFMSYEVVPTGTPPKRMRWRLDQTSETAQGIKVVMKIPDATARAV